MRVLVFNQKGGVGKTTTAVNLGAALMRRGVGRVVLADLDPQMHLTAGLGHLQPSFGWNVTGWLSGVPGEPLPCAEDGLLLVPGAAGIDLPQPVATPDAFGAEWVVMDAAPSWTPALAAVMTMADLILCPLEPDFLGLQGLNRLLRVMSEAGVARDSLRLLPTRYDARLAVHREVVGRLQARFGEALLPCVIRRSVRLSEAPGHGVSVFRHAPRSSGATDHLALADALMVPRARRREQAT